MCEAHVNEMKPIIWITRHLDHSNKHNKKVGLGSICSNYKLWTRTNLEVEHGYEV